LALGRLGPGDRPSQCVAAAVTLTGTVDSQALRERAIQLAGSVNGVAQMQDRLEVRP
jgi:osmotically-inducible protein OsmY